MSFAPLIFGKDITETKSPCVYMWPLKSCYILVGLLTGYIYVVHYMVYMIWSLFVGFLYAY